MNFKKLGNTDIDVSTICLGTMTWGEQNSEKDAFEQMDYAFEQNVNFGILLKYTQYLLKKALTAKQRK